MSERPDGARTVPYVCAYCGEEDLRPVPNGRWHCRSCLRVFSVAFHGIEPASFSTPVPVTATGSITTTGSTP
jgi:ribosomal protein L37AE/L43A